MTLNLTNTSGNPATDEDFTEAMKIYVAAYWRIHKLRSAEEEWALRWSGAGLSLKHDAYVDLVNHDDTMASAIEDLEQFMERPLWRYVHKEFKDRSKELSHSNGQRFLCARDRDGRWGFNGYIVVPTAAEREGGKYGPYWSTVADLLQGVPLLTTEVRT